jgi:DUF1009 family protein
MPADTSPETLEPLGIIAGSGGLPVELARAVTGNGRRVFIVARKGAAGAGLESFPHRIVELGDIYTASKALREAGCRELVFIGKIGRPRPSELSFGWRNIRYMPQVMKMIMGGGDAGQLHKLAGFVESIGFRVTGVSDVAPELVAPLGVLGVCKPGEADRRDLAQGWRIADRLGELDIGQGCVVVRGRVMAVEAAEGTDAMLERVAGLGPRVGAGVLLKKSSHIQDLRMDLPVVGPRTVKLAIRAGLGGIGFEAGKTIIHDLETVIGMADRADLFIMGLAGEGGVLSGTSRQQG